MVCFVNHNGLTLSFGKKLKEQYLLRMRLTASDNIGYKSLLHIVFSIICFIGVGKVSLLPFLCCSLTFALLILSSQFFRNLLKPLIHMMRIPHSSKWQLLSTLSHTLNQSISKSSGNTFKTCPEFLPSYHLLCSHPGPGHHHMVPELLQMSPN